VAEAAGAQFDGTVICAELDWLDADANLATALAAELNLTVDSDGALETLTEFLNERNTLMLLDNGTQPTERVRRLCEHLHRQAPGLSIVVAARSQLGIAEERSIVVPPLDDNAALELFKARLEAESFASGGDGALLADILRHLGGNPAAIESAARQVARIGSFPMLDWLETNAGSWSSAEELEDLASRAAVRS
jgi:predicted ATPase